MKKMMIIAMLALMGTTTATACPLWECNYPVDYYGCGCQCNQGTHYNQYQQVQPIYCQYCGHEAWDCVCDVDYSQGDCNYDWSYSYQGAGTCTMLQWANIRDENGCIIGQANAGDAIEIYSEDCETGRLWIYDYTVGLYGSVLADCVYGTYQWDGTGDNGYYNQYQGSGSCYQEYQECGYSYQRCASRCVPRCK
jgi:hypothetical protein